MISILSQMWLFFWRDLSIARTYRTVFVVEAVEALFGAATFYYIGRFVDSPGLQRALPQGGSYFPYSLLGFVFLDYLNAALETFDHSLQEARDSGTLEHLLVTQTSLPIFVAGSALYPFVATTLRIAVYLLWSAALFGFPLRSANWLSVGVILLASLLAFSGLGILSSSYLLGFKRGNPAKWFVLGITSIVGGTLPVFHSSRLAAGDCASQSVLALDARRALLSGANLATLWRPIATLLLFAAILLPHR
jgi:hypothetical protein